MGGSDFAQRITITELSCDLLVRDGDPSMAASLVRGVDNAHPSWSVEKDVEELPQAPAPVPLALCNGEALSHDGLPCDSVDMLALFSGKGGCGVHHDVG